MQTQQRRKSPWNLILIPLVILGVVATAFALAAALLGIQRALIPDAAVLSSYTRIGSILMFVPILFPSLAFGMMIANLIAWCIPPARRTFEEEAKDVKRASFRKTMRALVIASVILLAVTAPFLLLGTMNYFYVDRAGVCLNPLFSLSERCYGWEAIKDVRIRCLAERRNLHLNYRLTMRDGTTVDLLNEPRMKFVKVFQRIAPFLEAQKGIAYHHEITERGVTRLRKRYRPEDAEHILGVLRSGL